MKKTLFTFVCAVLSLLSAQAVSNTTIHVSHPGELYDVVKPLGLTTLTDLTVTGTIDARDFRIMRDSLTKLDTLNIIDATIAPYVGMDGSSLYLSEIVTYFANTIPEDAFYFGTIKKIILPSTTEVIGSNAFCLCLALQEVVMPESVKQIDMLAFGYCGSLTKINIPRSLRVFSREAFSNCTSLKNIAWPDTITEIGESAFTKTLVTPIAFPNSVSILNSGIFMDCPNVRAATFPDIPNLTVIPQDLYRNCDGITHIAIPQSIVELKDYCFRECDGIKSFVVPEKVNRLRNSCFKDCKRLKSFYIPASVQYIHGNMLYGDTALTNLKVMAKVPVSLSSTSINNVFYNINKTKCTLYVPLGSKVKYQDSLQWKDFTNIVELDSVIVKSVNITAGGLSGALTNQEKVTTTKLTLTGSIDVRDFKFIRDEMPFIEDINLSGVTIEDYVGADSTLMRSASLAYPANTIPFNALRGKTGLRIITLPSSLIAIGDSAFWGCTQLRLLELHNSSPMDLNFEGKALDYVSKSTCVLSVPKDAVSAYRSAEIWNSFNIIEENAITTDLDTSGTGVSPITISSQNGVVVVKGLTIGQPLVIYNLSGGIIYKQIATADSISLNIKTSGVYIFKGGNRVVKFIV